MRRNGPISTHESLLQLLEAACLGGATVRQLTGQVRRAHPLARSRPRVEAALKILESEGLIESTQSEERVSYRTTSAGLAALESRGRFPHGAAVLFTDLVDSTKLIGTLGEAAAHDARNRHFALLRQVLTPAGGREIKNLGDGLMVIFSDASRAAECAVEMQRRVVAGDDGLALRIGMHFGELLREDGDFFGSTVIIAKRLCDAAGAGEILISDQARALVGGAIASTIHPIGAIQLKGIDGAVSASMIESAPILSGATS